MKSKIVEKEKEKKSKYPCLKESFESEGGRMVVLFDRPKQGMVVYSTWSCGNPVGNYSWFWDESKFQLFEGKIELSNDGI